MEKPRGYNNVMPSRQSKRPVMRNYLVYINDVLHGETSAVSPEKAANNVRWQIYKESSGWWDVPPIEAFDCVEKKNDKG